MAQTFPTSAQVIYDTLATDPVFVGFLGTYTFEGNNGVTSPAISIVSPGQSMPEIRNVEGLECIIQDTGDVKRMDYVAGDSDFTVDFDVFLICWEESNGVELTNATLQALKRFSGATAMETVAASNGIGALVQTMITIPSNKPILA